MDIYTIRQDLRTKTIYDIPLRVTFYARVSSDKDEQLNSLDNQIAYYTELIKKNKKWIFVPGYIDEGLSGISTTKRENFHNMINDAEQNKFDLIITKEISRFARNTLDSIQYTRKLLTQGVAVFFQNDNINTLDEDSELRLTIMSGIAQDELRKLSSRIKFGHKQAIKNNVVLGNSRIFGYDKKNKKLVINEPEAKMVRELFELYATDQYSMKQIENIFWERGYRNHNGNKISHSTMSNTISNPKYKGYYVGNKVQVVDMFTKKQKFLPPEEWVVFKDETGEIVPAIVDEELWERANRVLQRRSNDVKNRQNKCNHPNLFTGKLFCTHCGKSYYRRESRRKNQEPNSMWVCSGRLENGKDTCPSFSIYENELKPILLELFNETAPSVDELIETYIETYKKMDNSTDISKRIKSLEEKIEFENKKKSKLLDYNIAGSIGDEDYIKMNNECLKIITEYEMELEELRNKIESNDTFKEHINNIRSTLQDAKKDLAKGIITKGFVDRYIDKIFVTPINSQQMKLEIRILTGKTCSTILENSHIRSGHIFKKMIEDYENKIK